MFHDANFYAGDAVNGVFRSSDQGMTWENIVDGLNSNKIWCLGKMGPTILAGAWLQFVHRSNNNGTNWEYVSDGINGGGCTAFATIGGRLFAGISGTPTGGGVYMSNDTGQTWERLLDESIWGLAVVGDKLIAGSSANGIFTSTDFGATWTESMSGVQISKLLAFGNGRVIAATIDGMSLSMDAGETWINVSEGLFDPFYAYSLAESGGYIYVGTDYGTWRRSIGELEAAAVDQPREQQTFTFEISPNPTIGRCTIQGLPTEVHAITVLNCLGQSVLSKANLHGETITLDLSSFPAGSYVVCMKTATAVSTKTIIKQ
jgi:hypothetical protein